MKWKVGQDFIDRLRFSVIDKQKYKALKKGFRIAFGKELYSSLDPFSVSTTHNQYGKIYYPIYNLWSCFDCRDFNNMFNAITMGGGN